MAIEQLISFAPFDTNGLTTIAQVNAYTPAYLNASDAAISPPAINVFGNSIWTSAGMLISASGTSNGQICYVVCVAGVAGKYRKNGVWRAGCYLGGGRGPFIVPIGATLQSGSLPYKNPDDRYYEVKIDWTNKTIEYRLAGVVIALYTFTDPAGITVKVGFNALYPYTGAGINDIYLVIDNDEKPNDITNRYLGPLTITQVPLAAIDDLTTDNTVVGGLTPVNQLNTKLSPTGAGYVTTSPREKKVGMAFGSPGSQVIGVIFGAGAFKDASSASALYQEVEIAGVSVPAKKTALPNTGMVTIQQLCAKPNGQPYTAEEISAARSKYYSKHD